jgi:hypothetical protein
VFIQEIFFTTTSLASFPVRAPSHDISQLSENTHNLFSPTSAVTLGFSEKDGRFLIKAE